MVSRSMQEPSRTSPSDVQMTPEHEVAPQGGASASADANVAPAPAEAMPDAIILDPAQLPQWQRAFVLGPNVRFTRTPSRNASCTATPELPVTVPPPNAVVTLPEPADGPNGVVSAAPSSSVRALQQHLKQTLEAAGHRPDQGVDVPAQSIIQGGIQQGISRSRIGQRQHDSVDPTAESREVPARTISPAPARTRPPGRVAIPDHLVWEMLSLGASELAPHPKEVLQPAPPPAPARLAPFQNRVHPHSPPGQAAAAEPLDSSSRLLPQVVPVETTSAVRFYRQIDVKAPVAGIVTTQQRNHAAAEAADVSASQVQPEQQYRRPQPLALPACEVAISNDYRFPPVHLLQPAMPILSEGMSAESLEKSAGLLESVLEDFGIKGDIIDVRPGPVVTLYEFEPAPGVKSSRIINLSDDIARSMSALSARVAVVPGRNVIGIELPNPERETVFLRELVESRSYISTDLRLPLCLGKTIGGEPVIADLAKMPHLLVAGTTGSGKSVAINTMILSLIYHLRPDECRLIMVDPKMLELSVYDGIPHLLTPVVTDAKKAVLALKWAVREMEDRYRKMSRLGVRNIDGFNMRVAEARRKGETILVTVPCGFDRSTGQELFEQQQLDLASLPYIVVIVDEMADLMMVAGKEIEGAIQRLAQMARAAGIHLIMATQRPSVDVITGTIKANFPTRISFQVTSKIDSRTILGEQGAEHLLGQGDMLHMVGGGRIARVHGPFVSDHEVEKVVAHLKAQGQPSYLGGVTEETDADAEHEEDPAVFDETAMGTEPGCDDLYERAVKIVLRDNKCSTSYIQRRLSIGYNRAASLVERMEQEGLVGPPNHVGKRDILSARTPASPDDA